MELDFGFLFCRAMHFYSLGYSEMLDLPIKTFWFMNHTIDRIRAQQEARSIGVSMCSQGGEFVSDYREQLVLEIGTVVKVNEDPLSPAVAYKDKAGIEDLRAMTGDL